MQHRNGDPIWIDLGTDSLEKVIGFYTEMFGWKITDQGDEYGHYHMITKDGQPVGGAMNSLYTETGELLEEAPYPNAWTVYLATSDIEKALEKVPAVGGTIYFPAMDVGTLGKMAIIGDGAGAALGLWEPHDFEGITLNAKIGTPVWFESLTQDFDAALPLYRDVLDWDLSYMPTDPQNPTRYVTNAGEKPDAATAGLCDGAGFLPQEVPSHWRMYILVENTDIALEKLKSLGGTVLDGPFDSPFGRLATVTDNAGAAFQIIQPMDGAQ